MKDYLSLISDIYKMMSDNNILLTYLGDITPDITNALLRAIKNDNQKYGTVAIKKKMYKIIVECLENIYRHSNLLDKQLQPSIFLLGKIDNYYYIVTGNYINNKQVNSIKDTVDVLNNLDRDDIKDKYREVISKVGMTDDGGAGLGMIDIAIKSGNKLEYEFIHVDDAASFYILKVKVSIDQTEQ